MTIFLVDHLTLKQIQPATEFSQAQSEVLLDNRHTGIIVPGSILEAAVEISAERYLLFITDGILFEESLTIVLCQLELGVLEVIHIGAAYHSGQFSNLSLCDDHIRFHFMDEKLWTLQVTDTAQVTLPFIGDSAGVQRQFGFKKWIILKHQA